MAKDFLGFIASVEGTEALTAAVAPSGPYVINGSTLPDDVPAGGQGHPDRTSTRGAAAPALEFLSPVKGPALEQITVAVGSGQNTAEEGAELYDQDVEKQATAARPAGLVSRRRGRPPQGARPGGRPGCGRPPPPRHWTRTVADGVGRPPPARRRAGRLSLLVLPAGAIVFGIIFVVPTLLSFYYSLTRWTLFDAEFIGLDNFVLFFREPSLTNGLRNTIVYAVVTSGLKVVLGLLLAALLTSSIRLRNVLRSIIFFPVLVSTVAVGITFAVLMHPSRGLINIALAPSASTARRGSATRTSRCCRSRSSTSGRASASPSSSSSRGSCRSPRSTTTRPASRAAPWVQFRHVIVPLSRNATFTVILLSFIGGLRTFDLIWTMTRGGPGFATDVLTSTIYKQYQAGFYGLATAGNVILFIAVTALVYPMMRFFSKREIEL